MITIRPHWLAQRHNAVFDANSIAEVRKEIELDIRGGNLVSNDVTFPKHMRVAVANPPPSFIAVTLDPPTELHFSAFCDDDDSTPDKSKAEETRQQESRGRNSISKQGTYSIRSQSD